MKIGKIRIGPGDLVEAENIELAPDEIEKFEKMIRASIELKNTPPSVIPREPSSCFVMGCERDPLVMMQDIIMPSGETLKVRICERHAAYIKDVFSNVS